jgi:hypothetical protein
VIDLAWIHSIHEQSKQIDYTSQNPNQNSVLLGPLMIFDTTDSFQINIFNRRFAFGSS